MLLVGLAVLLGRRLPRPLQGLLLVALAGIAMQTAGDWQVADALWRTTGDSVRPGSESGHDLAGLGDLVVVLSGAAFAIVAGAMRRVSPAIAGVALVMVVIPPPFFYPAAGVLFVLLHALVTGRSMRPRDHAASD